MFIRLRTIFKLYRIELSLFIIELILIFFYFIFENAVLGIVIIGILLLLTKVAIQSKNHNPIDDSGLFYHTSSVLSKRKILTQIAIPIENANCQEVMKILLNKHELQEMLSQKLPKGKYKTTTHSLFYKVIKRIDSNVTKSKVLYKDDLNRLRVLLLGKTCLCENIDCPYHKRLSRLSNNSVTDFYYVKFEIN